MVGLAGDVGKRKESHWKKVTETRHNLVSLGKKY